MYTHLLQVLLLVAMVSMLVACVAAQKAIASESVKCVMMVKPEDLADGAECANWPCPPVC